VVADRAYGTISGIEYMRAHKGDFALRLRAKAFNLYDERHKQVALLSYFKDLGERKSGSVDSYYKVGTEYKPIRMCATRKSAESERAGLTRLKKSNSKKQLGLVSAPQALYNRNIIVATSFGNEVAAGSIMELYRMRWQVEIVFKELKSLFGYNQIPSKLDTTARPFVRSSSTEGVFSPSTGGSAD
jgi:IS4 transposase